MLAVPFSMRWACSFMGMGEGPSLRGLALASTGKTCHCPTTVSHPCTEGLSLGGGCKRQTPEAVQGLSRNGLEATFLAGPRGQVEQVVL